MIYKLEAVIEARCQSLTFFDHRIVRQRAKSSATICIYTVRAGSRLFFDYIPYVKVNTGRMCKSKDHECWGCSCVFKQWSFWLVDANMNKMLNSLVIIDHQTLFDLFFTCVCCLTCLDHEVIPINFCDRVVVH